MAIMCAIAPKEVCRLKTEIKAKAEKKFYRAVGIMCVHFIGCNVYESYEEQTWFLQYLEKSCLNVLFRLFECVFAWCLSMNFMIL